MCLLVAFGRAAMAAWVDVWSRDPIRKNMQPKPHPANSWSRHSFSMQPIPSIQTHCGAAGAPKLGDKGKWAPLLKEGQKMLVATAIKGEGAMPPRGGGAGLSDLEIEANSSVRFSKRPRLLMSWM